MTADFLQALRVALRATAFSGEAMCSVVSSAELVRIELRDGDAVLASATVRRVRRAAGREEQLPLAPRPTAPTAREVTADEGRVEASAEIPTTPAASEDLDWRVIYYLPRRDWDRLGDVGRDQLHRPTGSPDPAEHVRWTVLATTARSEALREDEPRAAALGRLVERVGLHAVFAEAPRCKHCGCIATIPCVGGCRWATPAQDECSQCVEAHAALAEHLADQVVRLWCPLEGEGAASHVTWAGLHDGTCLDTTFSTKHGVIVAWSYTGDGVTAFVPRWLADLYTERWSKVGWRAERAAEGATETTLSLGTIVYELLVDDPRGATPGQRFDVIGVDAEAVRGRWGESDVDEDIPVERLERVAASQRLDGLVPAFWRVRGSSPSQSQSPRPTKARRALDLVSGVKASPSQSTSAAEERFPARNGDEAAIKKARKRGKWSLVARYIDGRCELLASADSKAEVGEAREVTATTEGVSEISLLTPTGSVVGQTLCAHDGYAVTGAWTVVASTRAGEEWLRWRCATEFEARVVLEARRSDSRVMVATLFDTERRGVGRVHNPASLEDGETRALAPNTPRATLDALRVGMRVRISSSAGGIEGVPVSLAGLFGVVEKLGPKRVAVRPDGRDRTWSIPPNQLELVEDEAAPAASAPSKPKRATKPTLHRDQGHSFDVIARTQSPNVACLIVGRESGAALHQRRKGVTEVAWRETVASGIAVAPEGTVARLYSQRGRCLWDSRDGGKP